MFASVGADGSVRMFDLRHLEHSTIIYEVAGSEGCLGLLSLLFPLVSSGFLILVTIILLGSLSDTL